MNPLDKNNCEFARFFKNLGYEYSWDFSSRDWVHYHELYKDNKPILQVEMIDWKRIVEDMSKEEEVENDYFVGCSDEAFPLYKKLCDEVREYVKNNPNWSVV